MDLSTFNSGDGQEVFYQIDQPHGIIIYIRKSPFSCVIVHFLIVGQQVVGISGNGSQRRTQIVRNSPKQIGPKLLILCQDRGFFFFAGILDVFLCQGALAQDGQQNTVFKGIQRDFVHCDTHDTIDLLIDPDRQIQAFGAG